MRRPAPVLLAALLAGGPAMSGAQEPPPRLDPVVVTPSRLEQRASESPASVTVISRDDVEAAPGLALDDVLRQVPGFSLFRRTSSLVAHPTAQGASLRGIGPSGTSRALVLLDGIPLNDPFGGWVAWNRLPPLSLEQVEVVRGGAASVWGSPALGGVVHLISRRPTGPALAAEGLLGSHATRGLDLLAQQVWGPWRVGIGARHLTTDGYKVVHPSQRGPIDIPADSEHLVVDGRLELALSPDLTLFGRGNYLDETRGNGTPLQVNDTRSGLGSAGARFRTPDGSAWTALAFVQDQEFHSTFSSQAPDRRSETLALDQVVPATSAGGSLGWSRRFGDHLVLAGADLRWIEGETDEDVFVGGAFARRRVAGGRQLLGGIYVQEVFTPAPAWELVGSLRADYWLTYDAVRRDTPPPPGVPPRQEFPDRDAVTVTPRLAALWHVTPATDLRASVYRGVRAPTLNELYRLFRVRNDVTAANPRLRPERLTGGELGVQQRWGPLEARVTGFWNDVEELIANVTLASPLPDCPPATTCRQRQNLDRGRIRGVETELELRLGRDWRLLASHLFTDARVVEAGQQPALEGRRLAQVPAHTLTLGVRYTNPALLSAAVIGRFVGRQYEDDLNTLPLGSFVVLDVQLARAVTRWAEVVLGVENLLDERHATGRSADGIVSIGAPRLVHGALRLHF